MYEDKILLRLRRKYKKDEAFAFLDKELQAAKFKVGELLSENEELKDENKRLNKIIHDPETIKEVVKEEQLKHLNKLLTEKGIEIRKLKDEINFWITKNK